MVSEPYVAQHYRGKAPIRTGPDARPPAQRAKRPPHFVDVEWDTAVELTALLPTDILLQQVPETPWKQMYHSGYAISEEAAQKVLTLWSEFHGRVVASAEDTVAGETTAEEEDAGQPTASVVPANRPPIPLPARRLLRTFAFDPMSTRLSGRFLVVDVPFEPDLKPGPQGGLVVVVDYGPARRHWYEPVDLNDPAVLAQDGLRPAENDPHSHQQVVYAVTMSVIERFERFLGRRFRWRGAARLRLVPHAFEGRNAYFDPARGAVLFGY